MPEEQWRRVKRISSLNRRQLAVAREVAAWRENEAQRRDVPKRWILGDESIVEIARRAPTTAADVSAIRGVADKVGKGAQRGIARGGRARPRRPRRRAAVAHEAAPAAGRRRRARST